MATVTSFLQLLEPLTPPVRPALMPEQNGLPDNSGIPSWVVQEAEARAQQILAQARKEAAELMEDARVQAEALREAAWQEGFHGGQEAGQTAAGIKAEADAKAYRDALRTELEGMIADIGQARQALWEQQEVEMVSFVLDIARQVIKTEVTQNPDVIAQILKNALRRVTDKENVRIRVSLADAHYVREMRDDLLILADGVRHLEIIDDRRVGGGCVIETNAGTIDAKVETQLAEIERALNVQERT